MLDTPPDPPLDPDRDAVDTDAPDLDIDEPDPEDGPEPIELDLSHYRMPTYAQLSVRLNELVLERDGEWAGLPLPLPGSGLVLEPRHPKAALIAAMQADFDKDLHAAAEETADEAGWTLINEWRTCRHNFPGMIVLARHEDGRTRWGFIPDHRRVHDSRLNVFVAVDAWDLEAEFCAMERLASLVTPHAFKCYALLGGFLESSKRSGLTYWFRRQRPTLVLNTTPKGMRALMVALCLHPLGFYTATWCGAMVPTDDVIAHLVMMRADERRYWSRANHISLDQPEAGL